MSLASYAKQNTAKKKQLESIMEKLPSFCKEYFNHLIKDHSYNTCVVYAYDISSFLKYLTDTGIITNICNCTEAVLCTITNKMIMEYLSFIGDEDPTITDTDSKGKNRQHNVLKKITVLRSFFNFFYRKGITDTDIMSDIITHRIKEKSDTKMISCKEYNSFMDNIRDGKGLSCDQRRYHEKTKLRDEAIVALISDIGISIAECVSLDISDINIKHKTVLVTDRHGEQIKIHMSDQAVSALKAYWGMRKKIQPVPGSETAFFLSLQKKRITVRTVQIFIKKYSENDEELLNCISGKRLSTFRKNTRRTRHTINKKKY